MDEIQQILERYHKRDIQQIDQRQNRFIHYVNYTKRERESVYSKIVKQYVSDISTAKIIEIGAGDGASLLFFKQIGFKDENIFANELRPQKEKELKKKFPNSYIHVGNAFDLPFTEEFDICFQSTVFTSILNDDLKKKIAERMFTMTKRNGIVLWYDFVYDNPRNKDVKGVKKEEVKILFPLSKKITFYNVMLAPPVGRAVGRLYPIFNFLFPFLRSHVIAIIEK